MTFTTEHADMTRNDRTSRLIDMSILIALFAILGAALYFIAH